MLDHLPQTILCKDKTQLMHMFKWSSGAKSDLLDYNLSYDGWGLAQLWKLHGVTAFCLCMAE